MSDAKLPGIDSGDIISRTVLIVDDESSIASMLEKILLAEDIPTIVCNDAFCAIDILNKRPVDILVSDLRMPGMGGVDLVKEARKIREDIDVVIITGYGTMEVLIEVLQEGVSNFILKPIDRSQFVKVIRGLLEKKTLEESLVERTRQLVQSEKMATVGIMSTGMAHEINNPITFIRANLQLMQEYVKRLSPRLDDLSKPENVESVRSVLTEEFPEMIKEALEGTGRVQKIISGIKHYAHMGEEGLDSYVDIREVIAQSVNLVRTKLRKNITITENYLNLIEIKGHFSKLEQVFVNLLINAGDAIDEKIKMKRAQGDKDFLGVIDVSSTIIKGVASGSGREQDYLVLTFYDNGNGIPEEKVMKIFDPFFTTKSVGVGTGLGLYICYEIIKQHGGDISVQSEKGEGTAFIIKLPVEGTAKKENEKEPD